MITVLLDPEDLAAGASSRIEIDGAAYRHLFRSRRLPAGARLRAVDGHGRARWAEVERVERRRALLVLGSPAPAHEAAYRLRLAVAAPRAARAAWLVEKATEIGVRSIRFIATERAPRKIPPASLERLRRVARAAVEQSHRSRLPEIAGVEPWEAVVASLAARSGAGDRFVLDPGARPGEGWRAAGGSGVVLVGPEGGWSGSELRELEHVGCRPVSLGERTLRVETAALAAAAKLLL